MAPRINRDGERASETTDDGLQQRHAKSAGHETIVDALPSNAPRWLGQKPHAREDHEHEQPIGRNRAGPTTDPPFALRKAPSCSTHMPAVCGCLHLVHSDDLKRRAEDGGVLHPAEGSDGHTCSPGRI